MSISLRHSPLSFGGNVPRKSAMNAGCHFDIPNRSSPLLHPILTNTGKWRAIEGRQLSRNVKTSDPTSALLGKQPKVEVAKDRGTDTDDKVDVDAGEDVDVNGDVTWLSDSWLFA